MVPEDGALPTNNAASVVTSAVSRPVCVHMFSGGRDSTLAAVRLSASGFRLVLVTVTSDHLYGIAAVESRVQELHQLLPADTLWIRVAQPRNLFVDVSFYKRTCLPCHHAYVAIALKMAAGFGASHIAFGYVRYQDVWPEQTPLATCALRRILADLGYSALLPVYDLDSKAAAEAELTASGLSSGALEQKCSRQVFNVALADDHLADQVDKWAHAIEVTARSQEQLELEILGQVTFKDMQANGRTQA